MAHCKSCSAPLDADTDLCKYCGVRNDVDLQEKYDFSVKNAHSGRICPRCNIPLQTIDLKVNVPIVLERCGECFGLFFDPGELDILLANAVSDQQAINLNHLQNIINDRYQHIKVAYIKCPVCRTLMDRVNFGYRSGVVSNQCRKHGIWLDNGEITHLIEWKKAGGQLLAQQKQQEQT